MFSHQRKQYLGVFYSLKARAIANFGVFERVRAFVGVWTTAFLSVVFYTFKTVIYLDKSVNKFTFKYLSGLKRNIVVKVHWRFVIGVALRFTATTVLLVVLRLV